LQESCAFQGLIKRGDDENKLNAEKKWFKINFSQRKWIILLDFVSPFC